MKYEFNMMHKLTKRLNDIDQALDGGKQVPKGEIESIMSDYKDVQGSLKSAADMPVLSMMKKSIRKSTDNIENLLTIMHRDLADPKKYVLEGGMYHKVMVLENK